MSSVWLEKMLDNVWRVSIIIFTAAVAGGCVPDAGKGFQTRSLAGAGNFESAAPRSHRPAIRYQQLFRSQGSRPGQIRDAPPGAERGPFGDGRRDGFRLLPALLLSSAVGLPRGGLGSLVPHKRGPKQAHKLTDEVLAFIVETRQKGPSLRTSELVRLIRERFGTKVHRRSIERSLLRHQKKRR